MKKLGRGTKIFLIIEGVFLLLTIGGYVFSKVYFKTQCSSLPDGAISIVAACANYTPITVSRWVMVISLFLALGYGTIGIMRASLWLYKEKRDKKFAEKNA